MSTRVLIYRFLNKVNGKVYVGKTHFSLAHRKGQHLSDARAGSVRPIHAALRKYGLSSFVVEILDIADSEELGALKERFHIALNDAMVPRGYNLTVGGEGAAGRIVSAEHRLHLSQSLRGKTWPEKRKQAWSRALTGKRRKPLSEATKLNISLALVGRAHSPERVQASRAGRHVYG